MTQNLLLHKKIYSFIHSLEEEQQDVYFTKFYCSLFRTHFHMPSKKELLIIIVVQPSETCANCK